MTTRRLGPVTALLSLALGLGTVAGVTSAPSVAAVPDAHHERAGAPYAATLGISTNESMIDQAVTLAGQVKPVARGTVVKLQKKLEGKDAWTDEKTLKTNAAGRFTYTDKPTTAGKRQYRVVVPATPGHAKDISKPVSLVLYRWIDLTKVSLRSAQATYSMSSIAFDGATYSRGFVGSIGANTGSIDWNLDRRCTSLKTRIGNGDASDDTASAVVEIDVDGDPAYTGSFMLTESVYKVVDLTGVFRLAFKWTSTNSAGTDTDQSGAQAAMASPLVRCSF